MQEGGTNPIMFDLLLIDMVGILDEDHTPTVLSVIRDRLRLPRVNVDLVSEEFFMRTLPGLVAPVEIERALNELEEYILEGWQGEMAPGDFLIVLVIDQHTSGPFILQVLEEMTQRTVLVPTVLPLEIRSKGRQRIVLGERRDLPLKWRCQLGDTVVLITDVWLAGECEENGDPPLSRAAHPSLLLNGPCVFPSRKTGMPYWRSRRRRGRIRPSRLCCPGRWWRTRPNGVSGGRCLSACGPWQPYSCTAGWLSAWNVRHDQACP